MILRGDRLWLHRGGGKQPLRAGRHSIAAITEEGSGGFRLNFHKSVSNRLRLLVFSGLGYYFSVRGLKVSLSGPVEAKWVREVLERWRAE